MSNAELNPIESKISSLSAGDELRVLLVDDQPMIGEAVRRLVASESDFRFSYCASATDALATAIRLGPTVILQDLVMPDMDGLELLRQYRHTSELRDVPVIVLSTKEEPA